MNAAPLRVLIVDDEAPARSRMRDLLADIGDTLPVAVVAEVATGREALEAAATGGIDVVLLDVRMPGMDGVEVAQHLQQLERPPAVIFTTAYDAYAIRAFELHAVDYLLKPIRAARLQEALTRAAGTVTARVAASAPNLPQRRRAWQGSSDPCQRYPVSARRTEIRDGTHG